MISGPSPSQEQQNIIDAVQHHNIIVDAVAGSGKTTTICHIVATYPDIQFLVLTYNKRLRYETRDRLITYQNVSVHTYHSFCHANYYPAETDRGLHHVLTESLEPYRPNNYQCIILDEVQDMTPTFYEFVLKIVRDNGQSMQLIIFGDYGQSINDYNLADARYITMADQLYGKIGKSWCRLPLSISYRLTHPMRRFLHEWILKPSEHRIQTVKDGPNVTYRQMNVNQPAQLYEMLIQQIAEYTIHQIYVIAPSITSKSSPVRKLANYCSDHGIPIYIPSSEDVVLDDTVLRNKLVFSTYHQTKGLERECVIVLGFDQTYYKYYGRTASRDRCPNIFYVALTRARTKLIVVQHNQAEPMPFIRCGSRLQDIREYSVYMNGNIDIQSAGITQQSVDSDQKVDPPPLVVTRLIRHLPYSLIRSCMDQIGCRVEQSGGDRIQLMHMSKQGPTLDSYELVSNLLGIAIPAYYEWTIHNTLSIGSNDRIYREMSIDRLLKMAIRYDATRTGYNHLIRQISRYDFLTQVQLDQCMDRMTSVIPKAVIFERVILNDNISGSVDAIDEEGKIIWEFKCVQNITEEHILQVICYAALMMQTDPTTIYQYKIFNIVTGEILVIDPINAQQIVDKILEYKRQHIHKSEDEEFMEQQNEIYNRYFRKRSQSSLSQY